MIPNLFQVLTYGWTMLVAYMVILGWTVIFGLHVRRPGGRGRTIRILWSLCLVTLGVAVFHGNYHEMRISRLLATTFGAVDPSHYHTVMYLGRAGSSPLAVCAMVQAVLTCWAAFLISPPTDSRIG